MESLSEAVREELRRIIREELRAARLEMANFKPPAAFPRKVAAKTMGISSSKLKRLIADGRLQTSAQDASLIPQGEIDRYLAPAPVSAAVGRKRTPVKRASLGAEHEKIRAALRKR